MWTILKRMMILVTFIVFGGCSEQPTDSDKLFTVRGRVFHRNAPLGNATISLDRKVNFTTESDRNGDFEITNVPKGTYTMSVEKTFVDGSFTQKSSTLDVQQDISLNELRLPSAVVMDSPNNVTATSASLSWSSSDANDFREYKLYRHTTSGLDENTGTLIHVATSRNDTMFVDNSLSELTAYFYRVYVMNDFGRMGGSNIVSAKTLNQNIIVNGDFEQLGTDGLPVAWIFADTVFSPRKDINVQHGEISLKGDTHRRYFFSAGASGSLAQRIPYTKLAPRAQYRLSIWYFVENFEGSSMLLIHLYKGNSLMAYDNIRGSNSTAWQQYAYEFTTPTDLAEDYLLRFEINAFNDEAWVAWIDNIEMTRKE